MKTTKNVLVLCTGNSCRSQIAHGWLSYFTGGTVNIYSAGIETHGVNLKAIATMAEEGIDLSNHTSNLVMNIKILTLILFLLFVIMRPKIVLLYPQKMQ